LAKDRRGYWAGIAAAAIGLAMLASSVMGQEVPPSQPTGKVGVHQFGIIVRGDTDGSLSLDLPAFVHRSEDMGEVAGRLDFSALYFLPPLMMPGPVTLDVRQSLEQATAWYPYSHETSSPKVRAWDNLLMGVQADGLETTHAVWMTPRRMETASTVKVYKPGPTGSRPDDEGTTEGDVYIFLRGAVPDDGVFYAVGKTEALVKSPAVDSTSSVAFTSATEHAWLAMTGADGEIRSLRITMPELGKELRVQAEGPTYKNQTLQLRVQLNEALAGNGLRGDEAAAQADLVLQLLANVNDEPVLVYLQPREWVDKAMPLEVKGEAEKPVRVFVTVRKAAPVEKL